MNWSFYFHAVDSSKEALCLRKHCVPGTAFSQLLSPWLSTALGRLKTFTLKPEKGEYIDMGLIPHRMSSQQSFPIPLSSHHPNIMPL